LPKQYEAEMKLVVKRERADAMVTAEPNSTPQPRTDVSEDELNSEVELIRSRDLLEQVAAAAGLLERASRDATAGRMAANTLAERVVRQLEADLKVTPIRKTTFIRVTYRSPDPHLAARVLTVLADRYLEKHRTVHRPAGAYEFFTDQAKRFATDLADAEARLTDYGRRAGVVSAELEQQTALQRVAEFESALQQARAEIAASNQAIADLDAQMAATPPRHTTQIRTSDDADLIRELKSRVLTLEGERAAMAQKFAPTYPALIQLEDRLEQARRALRASERSPVTEQTTDENPTHQWLRGELARARSERAAATARAASYGHSVRTFLEKARQLGRKAAAEQELKRSVKSAEDNYLLYTRKQEEARISNALDRARIANVAVATPASVPSLPAETGRAWLLILGACLALVLGAVATYLLAYLSPHFHTPQDVIRELDVPVLATLRAQ
jgi:uncharacterized protein involved in exopolysaccharide biosynthesis